VSASQRLLLAGVRPIAGNYGRASGAAKAGLSIQTIGAATVRTQHTHPQHLQRTRRPILKLTAAIKLKISRHYYSNFSFLPRLITSTGGGAGIAGLIIGVTFLLSFFGFLDSL